MRQDKLKIYLACVTLYILIFTGLNPSWCQDESYPAKIYPVTKHQAEYTTPENTLAAGFSALMYNDLEGYYKTLTEKSAAYKKAQFAEAGIDPKKKYDLVNPGNQLFLLEKLNYKNGILLYTKFVSPRGTIAKGPAVFVQENGLWKQTFEYSGDEELFAYMDIAIPEEILNPEIQISPNQWNLQWYRQMLNKKPNPRSSELKKVTVLCVLGNLRDSEGNDFSVEDIDPETLLLNYVVKPVTWDNGAKEETAVLINNDKQPTSKTQKLFKNWENQPPLHQGFQKPVMLVKFSKFEAMKSLDNPDFGKTYTITVSGKLKDEQTHFRGETQITLVPHGPKSKQQSKASAPPFVENPFDEHWWDNMD